MYFSAAANYHEGFLRALSVASGKHMPRLGKPSLVSQTTHLERVSSAVDRSVHKSGTIGLRAGSQSGIFPDLQIVW